MTDKPTPAEPMEDQPQPAEVRSCANCACAFEAKHPTLINRTQLLCRLRPPMLITQQGQDEHGRRISEVSLTYAPTAPDLVCFDGWRPIGVEPGQKPLSMGGLVLPPEISGLFQMIEKAIAGQRDQ